MPNFDEFSSLTREHHIWLGQAHALVSKWDKTEAMAVKMNSNSIDNDLLGDSYLTQVLLSLHRVIADLELELLSDEQAIFDVVDVYLQKRRDSNTAKRFFKRLLKSNQGEPWKIVTDRWVVIRWHTKN